MPIASASDDSVIFAHVVTVDLDGARCDVVEARDQVADGRLARAARPDERRELARRDLELDPVQRPAAARQSPSSVVAEVDVAEARPAPRTSRLGIARGVRRVDDLVLQVEVLEDAFEERKRGLHLDRGSQHVADGPESRVCNAVKATSVPAVRLASPPEMVSPATR